MLLIESYVGERPADADRLLAPLRDRLRHRGVITGEAVMAALLDHRLPLPGTIDPALTAAEIAQQIDHGVKTAMRGNYQLAIDLLEGVLEAAHQNPSLVVSDERAQAWLTKALAGIAFARSRLGDPDGAAGAMAEQIRSFPAYPVTRDDLGPEVEKLYEATRRALEGGARGALIVEVNRPDAQIYLNEAARGLGGMFAGDLLPGTYRLLIAASGIGRRYAVEIRAGEEARLTIDWSTDARLIATPRWTGFLWPHGMRDRATRLAQRFARSGAPGGVIVVGIAEVGEHRYVVGHAYGKVTGALERVGSVELGERDVPKLVALPDYLASGERGREAIRWVADLRRPDRGSTWQALVWTSAGIAVASLGAGGYLIDLDSRSTCGTLPIQQCPRLYDTARLGWSLVGGGAAAVAFGTYWYAFGGRSRLPTIVLRRWRAGGLAAIAWSY